jgi:hypothetical protein
VPFADTLALPLTWARVVSLSLMRTTEAPMLAEPP